MKIPECTYLQFVVLNSLTREYKKHDEISDYLKSYEDDRSPAALTQLLSRMVRSKLVQSRKIKNMYRYRITPEGEEERKKVLDFYKSFV